MDTKAIKAYYEYNTKRFLKFGQHAETQAIHQPLWAPGIETVEEAVHYCHQMILEEFSVLKQCNHILDLGCGVGASLNYLYGQIDVAKPKFSGITISPTQIEIAKSHFKDKAIQFYEGDFLNLPSEIQKVDLAYCIEAFIHASSIDGFFKSVSDRMNKGGRLIIIDDLINQENITKENQVLLKKFEEGWHAGTLSTINNAKEKAAQNGFTFIKHQSLSPYLKIGRPRDKFISIYVKVMEPFIKNSYYFSMLRGGNAKQRLIKRKVLDYSFLVFEKKT